jgi:hypothetical protein
MKSSIQYLVVDAATGEVTDSGNLSEYPNVSGAGAVHSATP